MGSRQPVSSVLEFPRQEYWSGLLFPSPGNLPDPGIKLETSALAGEFFTTKPSEKPLHRYIWKLIKVYILNTSSSLYYQLFINKAVQSSIKRSNNQKNKIVNLKKEMRYRYWKKSKIITTNRLYYHLLGKVNDSTEAL